MSLRPPRRLRFVSGAQVVLEDRARLLAEEKVAEDEGAMKNALVSFQLEGSAYAMEMQHVKQVVSRLGAVVPVAGAPPSVRGVAFIDNLPHAILELARTVGGKPRPFEVLAHSPALVLTNTEGAFALSIDGPLEMLEVRGALMSLASTAASSDRLEISARLPEGALVISSAWLHQYCLGLGRAG